MDKKIKSIFIIMSGNDRLFSSDPAWSERVRRRRTFADAELERGMGPTMDPIHIPEPNAPPTALFCR